MHIYIYFNTYLYSTNTHTHTHTQVHVCHMCIGGEVEDGFLILKKLQ